VLWLFCLATAHPHRYDFASPIPISISGWYLPDSSISVIVYLSPPRNTNRCGNLTCPDRLPANDFRNELASHSGPETKYSCKFIRVVGIVFSSLYPANHPSGRLWQTYSATVQGRLKMSFSKRKEAPAPHYEPEIPLTDEEYNLILNCALDGLRMLTSH